ncbi:MAG: hypothetical protein COA80_11030 [Leeuwenhoekiella sp.]|nr:MAG: hypothetical protein COA80_11030 [Leeuwenhoekiella sp.]
MIRFLALLSVLISITSCNSTPENPGPKTLPQAEAVSAKIQVLNVGTFHFGTTSDAHATEFDENAAQNQQQVRELAQKLAAFKPTVICVEKIPSKNDTLNTAYQNFLKNPEHLPTYDGEISMLAFEIGRLAQVDCLYGIDNHMGYNYSVGDFIEASPELENSIDPETYLQLTNAPFKDHPELAAREANYEQSDLPEKFRLINEPVYLDFLINANADKLLYVGLEDGFEGADNAAIFYQRNMRIFSNLNRVRLKKDDRVLILMGGAHTAFLREFFKRSPKFEMVNTLDYL